jgi:hypothetical protein
MDNWKNEKVCKACWEVRHPQSLIRVPKDNPAVPWARPSGPDQFIAPACYIWDQSGFAGLGIAGCMQAGKSMPIGSVELYNMKFPPLF